MSRESEKEVYIRSRRPHHPALRFDNSIWDECNGRVNADQFESATQQECWTLKHLGNKTYLIKNLDYFGDLLYLMATREGEVNMARKKNDCKWTIERTRKGYFSIKSYYGKYLCCDEGFRVTANREHCELWEQWAIIDEPHLLTTPTRKVFIRSCRQQLCRNNNGLPALDFSSVKATRYGPATDSEELRVLCIDIDKVLLVSNYFYLSCGKDGKLKTINTKAFTKRKGLSWNIEVVEGTFRNAVALKSEFGRYLCCSNDDHFMCDSSLKADSTSCCDKRTWWVFLTKAHDIHGNMALKKEAITMKYYNIEYA